MADEALADHAAERALVESLLFDPDALAQVSHLGAEDLDDPALAAVLRALRACWARGEGTELPQLRAELRRAGALGAIGGERFLADLVEHGHSSAYVEVHGRRVAALARCRDAELSLRRALGALRSPEHTPEEALARAAGLAATLGAEGAARGFDLASHAARAWDEFDERARGHLVNACWGLASLDHELSLGGLIAGGLYVLAADTGGGKTTLAWQAALATAAQGRRVVVYSQEMPGPELVWRLAGARAGLSTAQIRSGRLADAQVEALGQATSALVRLPVEIRDTGEASPDRIRAEMLAEAARGGLGLVVVDYLQILARTPAQMALSRVEQIEEMSLDLRESGKSTGIPHLVLSQFNRVGAKGKEKDKAPKPTIFDLKGSGAIENDSHVVILLYGEGDADPVTHRYATILCDVQKNRLTGVTRAFPMRYEKRFDRFVDVQAEQFVDGVGAALHAGGGGAAPEDAEADPRFRDDDTHFDEGGIL